MTQFTFDDTAPGVRFFLNANFWSPKGTPGAGDVAILPAAANPQDPYKAIVSRSETVASIETGVGVVLEIGEPSRYSNVFFTATDGSGSGVNAGTIRVDGGGSVFDNLGTMVNTGTIIVAASSHYAVDSVSFGNNGVIDNTGKIDVYMNSTISSAGTLINSGTIDLNGIGCRMFLAGSVANSGAILLGQESFVYGNNVTFSGGGTVVGDKYGGIQSRAGRSGSITNFGNTFVDDRLGGCTFINASNGTISGGTLYSDLSVANSGLIEGAGAGDVTIAGAIVDGSGGGLILATDHSSVILDGGTIRGGTFQSSQGGVIRAIHSGYNGLSTLDGTAAPVSNEGDVEVSNGVIVYIQGAIVNSGTIGLDSIGARTWLRVTAQNAVLSGGGSVVLSGNPNNQILGTTSHVSGAWIVSTLANASTISGAGTVGTDLSLSNSGVIDATGRDATIGSNAAALVIHTGYAGTPGSNTIANSGLLEATNPSKFASTGGLVLRGDVIVNTPGQGFIEANGAATHVDLQSTTISGGNLRTSGGGMIDTVDGGSLLNGVSHVVFNQGALVIGDNTALTIQGTINNSGTLGLAAAADAATLIVGVGASLNGAGTVTLGDNPLNAIVEGPPGSKGMLASLTNVNDTIAGAGVISAILINLAGGVIRADGANALIIDTGSSVVTNYGLLRSSGTGGMTIRSAVTGSGRATIKSGTMNFQSAFSQDVTFAGITGVLELARSGGYAATIFGFSQTGGTALDLGDIAFGAVTKASYSGTTASGVLIVTDGTHTANIHFTGNYTKSAFTVSSDGHGGTTVTDPTKASPSPLPAAPGHDFVSAMAAFGAAIGVGAVSPGAAILSPHHPMLALARHAAIA